VVAVGLLVFVLVSVFVCVGSELVLESVVVVGAVDDTLL
jgi:hypothetical protein